MTQPSLPGKGGRDPRVVAALSLGAVIFGAAAGLELISRFRASRPLNLEGKGNFGQPPLAAPDARGIPKVRSPIDPTQASDFDNLMALLDEAQQEPAAKKFVEEFKKEPVLDEAWDDFEKDQNSEAPQESLESFARVLADKAEFRQLVAKFAQDPGFRQVAVTLSQTPNLKPIIQELTQRLQARRRSKIGTVASRRGGRAGGGGSAKPVNFGAGGSQGGTPAAGGANATASGVAHNAVPLTKPPSPDAAKQAEGMEGDGTTPLGDIPGTGSGTALNPWASLCYRDDPRVSKALCDVMTKLVGNPYDVWQACVVGKVYEQCVRACQAIPELKCEDPERWSDACRELFSAEECAKRCAAEKREDCDDEEDRGPKHPILGYARDGAGALKIDPKEQEIVIAVFKSYQELQNIELVAQALRARYNTLEDFNKKRGGPLGANSVATLLKREEYAGLGAMPRLLPKGLWEEVQAIRRSHRRK